MVRISKFLLLVSIFLAVLVALQFKECRMESRSNALTELVTVTVRNSIISHMLGIHCKDKHTDFGFKSLKYGEVYSFSFHPTFLIEKSLYFCSFNWGKGVHYFDIYIQTRDQDCFTDCKWHVKEPGPCKSEPHACFNWNPKP